MTTEEITQENQDQDPQELLQRMEETAWRQGQSGLEFFFSYLMVEIKFPNNNDDSTWELNTRGLDIDALKKALQREQDMMQQVLQNDSFPWVKFGIETKLVNAAEVQEYPYNFADLIFVSLSLPAWVMPPQRPKLLAKLRNILVLYRNNNPDAIIVSITKHAPFRLKDRLSYQWGELSRELGGIETRVPLLVLLLSNWLPQVFCRLTWTESTPPKRFGIRRGYKTFKTIWKHCSTVKPA